MTKTNEPLSMSDIMAKKQAVTKHVIIQLDGDVSHTIESLKVQLQDAERFDRRSNTKDTAPAIQRLLDNAVEDAKTTEQEFIFTSIGRERYDNLVQAHPPTKAQEEEGQQFNSETFPPALIAAACSSPIIEEDQAIEMFSDPNWNGAELLRLFYGALEANTEAADTPLSSSGSDSTLASLLSLASASNEGSPTPSI